MSDTTEVLVLLSTSLSMTKGVQGLLGWAYEYGDLDSREIEASDEVDKAVKPLAKAMTLIGEGKSCDGGERLL